MKEINRKHPIKHYLMAFIASTIIFILISLISYSISYLNYRDISSRNNVINDYINDLSGYISELNCSNQLLFDSSERLDEVGFKMSILENRFGKDDVRVISQKKLYTQLELNHFNIVREFNNKCNTSFNTIIFFYSNKKEVKDENERVGFVLSTLKNKWPEDVMIYSFDYNLDSYLIYDLKSKYKVIDTPFVLVNERDKVEVKNIKDIERLIK
ncbi:hypothetical protein HYW74_02480 [Candidatus Pacearchaeota archaeon]|nr:hypothetical protein [Candidatus Pacearchaeota archaeon]